MVTSSPAPPRIPPWLDRLAQVGWRFLVVVVAFLAVGFLLVRLRLVVLPIIAALLMATVLAFPTAWLKRRGWPAALAAWTVFLAALLLLVGLVLILAPIVAGQVDEVGASVREGVDQVERWLREGPVGLTDAQIGRAVDQATEQVRQNAGQIAGGLLTGAMFAIELIAGLILAAVILFFFLKDGDRMGEWILDRAPADRRSLLKDLGRRAWETLQGYIGGTAIVGLVDAVFIGIGLLVIGVPLVAPLMALFFFGAFFPYVGAIVAGIVTILVALVSLGPVEALLAGIVVLAVQQLEGNILQPVVLGRVLRLHPLVVLLSLTAGAVLGGLIGAFLAVPVAGVAAAVGNELRTRGVRSAQG